MTAANPEQIGESDLVELTLTGTVLRFDVRYGVDVAVVAVGPFEHTRQETIVVRTDRLRLVQRFEQ